jgi:hypothetical protein
MSGDAIGWIALLLMIAPGVIMGLQAALAALLRRPRSLSWGRGRWRLVAWYQVRLSPGTATGVAAVVGVALVAGSGLGLRAWLEAARRDPHWAAITVAILVGLCILIVVGGIVISVVGMVHAWRSGERHRWPERWSERPPDDVIESVPGLVPRGPGVPAPRASAPPTRIVPARGAAPSH